LVNLVFTKFELSESPCKHILNLI